MASATISPQLTVESDVCVADTVVGKAKGTRVEHVIIGFLHNVHQFDCGVIAHNVAELAQEWIETGAAIQKRKYRVKHGIYRDISRENSTIPLLPCSLPGLIGNDEIMN
jgi:hypothetical protein